MTWVLMLYLPLVALYLVVATPRGGVVNPDGLFVLFNSVAMVGTALSVDPAQPVDRQYCYIVLVLTSLYLLVSLTMRLRLRVPIGAASRIQAATIVPIRPQPRFLLLFGVSVLVSMGYYAAVGHITFLDSLAAASSGGSYDAATARLDSYAGAKYFFPGYVNQFKNSILPVLTLAFVHSWWTRRTPGRLPMSVAALALMVVMVAGTGQRAPLVIVFLVGLMAAWQARLLTPARALLALGVGFLAFAVMTLGLQRNAAQLNAVASEGLGSKVEVFGQALWSRVVLENPQSGLAAYHYTQPLPTAWGREWLTDILGVLPGSRGSDLANRVFEMLYGTPRGTAPPSLWGGMHYNFGLTGSLVVTTVIAAILMTLTQRFFLNGTGRPAPPQMNFLTVCGLSGMAVSAGAWVAGSPLTILNQGFFAYLFVVWISRRQAAAPATPGADTSPTPRSAAPELTRVR